MITSPCDGRTLGPNTCARSSPGCGRTGPQRSERPSRLARLSDEQTAGPRSAARPTTSAAMWARGRGPRASTPASRVDHAESQKRDRPPLGVRDQAVDALGRQVGVGRVEVVVEGRGSRHDTRPTSAVRSTEQRPGARRSTPPVRETWLTGRIHRPAVTRNCPPQLPQLPRSARLAFRWALR